MKDNNVVKEKSYAFAVRIVKLYKYLCDEKKEFTLSKQLLRSGTSIGANLEEAIGGHTDKDFMAKMSISYKECRETHFWLRLLNDTDYLTKIEFVSIIKDCDELLKLLGSIIKTMKERIKN